MTQQINLIVFTISHSTYPETCHHVNIQLCK